MTWALCGIEQSITVATGVSHSTTVFLAILKMRQRFLTIPNTELGRLGGWLN